MVASIKSSGIIQPGGGLTTTVHSGQQWDSPNAWPPLEHMLVEGFEQFHAKSGGKELADWLASAWLETNYMAWHKTGAMYEKYNGFKPGVGGGRR